MSFIKRHPILTAFAAFFLAVCILLCIDHFRGPVYDVFDIGEEGLVAVRVTGETGFINGTEAGKVEYFALASHGRRMKIDAFAPDRAQKYTIPSSCFTLGENLVIEYKLYSEDGKEAPVTREIADICEAMKDVGHDVMDVHVFDIGGELFAVADLNVNWWSPYHLYYYNKDARRLMLLCVFADQEVEELSVLSPERLQALGGESIGGHAIFTAPETCFEQSAEVFENAATMLLSHREVFDELYSRWNRRYVEAEGLVDYDYLNAPYRIEARISDAEQKLLDSLTAQLLPARIIYEPGEEQTCAALLIEYSCFNEERNRAERHFLVKLDKDEDGKAQEQTLRSLAEKYGEWKPMGRAGWYVIIAADK